MQRPITSQMLSLRTVLNSRLIFRCHYRPNFSPMPILADRPSTRTKQPALDTRMNCIQTPYYAPAEDLPAEIPDKGVTHSSNDVLCEQSARKVVGVGPHFVVKCGLQIELEEGLDMIYVENKTSVSVPKVFTLFKDVESNKKYIIMQRITGDRLDSI